MANFRCWVPEDGGEENAVGVSAVDAQAAAEEFFEIRWAEYDHADRCEISVRDAQGALTEWVVYAETVTSFRAAGAVG